MIIALSLFVEFIWLSYTIGLPEAGGAASRASAAPTTDVAAQHLQLAVGAAPTAVAAGLHLPEDGSYPKTSTTPTTPCQITSLCSFPLLTAYDE
jgi:hypothetical protein